MPKMKVFGILFLSKLRKDRSHPFQRERNKGPDARGLDPAGARFVGAPVAPQADPGAGTFPFVFTCIICYRRSPGVVCTAAEVLHFHRDDITGF